MIDQGQVLSVHIYKYFQKKAILFIFFGEAGHVRDEDISFNLVFGEMLSDRIDVAFEIYEKWLVFFFGEGSLHIFAKLFDVWEEGHLLIFIDEVELVVFF